MGVEGGAGVARERHLIPTRNTPDNKYTKPILIQRTQTVIDRADSTDLREISDSMDDILEAVQKVTGVTVRAACETVVRKFQHRLPWIYTGVTAPESVEAAKIEYARLKKAKTQIETVGECTQEGEYRTDLRARIEMKRELKKRFSYRKLELSLLPDKQIAKSATIGEIEELQQAIESDERADIIAELGDVLWCIDSWRLIEKRDSLVTVEGDKEIPKYKSPPLPNKLKAWLAWRSRCTRQHNPKPILLGRILYSNTVAYIRNKTKKMRPRINFRQQIRTDIGDLFSRVKEQSQKGVAGLQSLRNLVMSQNRKLWGDRRRNRERLRARIAQRDKVAALAHMTQTGKETHKRFHSSIITIRINDTDVDIEALDDSGAFAGFAPDSAVPYDIPRVHDHRPTGTASTASGGSLGPSTGT